MRNFFFYRKFYYPADAYMKSKLAQVLFSKHLDKICREENFNVQSHSLHPGVVNTDLFEHSSTSYVPIMRSVLFKVRICQFFCLYYFDVDLSFYFLDP